MPTSIECSPLIDPAATTANAGIEATGDPGGLNSFEALVDLGRVGAHPAVLVQRVDRDHLVGAELEAEDVEVLRPAVARVRLRDHDVARLQVPAQHDLGGLHSVRRRGILDRRKTEQFVLALAEWPPGLGVDSMLSLELPQFALLEDRVKFDLVDRRHDVVSASSLSRCGTRKLLTPMDLARPSARKVLNVRQVST